MVAKRWWGFKDNKNHRHVMVDKVLLRIHTHRFHPFIFANLQLLLFDAFFLFRFPQSWMPRSNLLMGYNYHYTNNSFIPTFFHFTHHKNHIFPQLSQTVFAVKMTTLFLFHTKPYYFSLCLFFFTPIPYYLPFLFSWFMGIYPLFPIWNLQSSITLLL